MEQERTTQTVEQVQGTENTEVTETTEVSESDVVAKARKAYSRSELNLAIFMLISIPLQLLLSYLASKLAPDASDKTKEILGLLFSFLPMYCIAFPIFMLLSRKAETCAPKKEKLSVGWFFGYLLIGRACSMIGTYISAIITAIIAAVSDIDVADTTLSDLVLGDNPTLILIFAVIFAPIVEELMFRKVLIDRVRKYGDGKAILISGILFGVFHGNVTQMIYAAALGLLLAFIYTKTGKIIHTILLHMAFNFLGSVAPLLFHADSLLQLLADPTKKVPESHLMLSGVFVLLNFAMTIAGLLLLVVMIAKGTYFRLDPPVEPIPKKKNFSVTCLNLGMLVFAVTIIGIFALNIFG